VAALPPLPRSSNQTIPPRSLSKPCTISTSETTTQGVGSATKELPTPAVAAALTEMKEKPRSEDKPISKPQHRTVSSAEIRQGQSTKHLDAQAPQSGLERRSVSAAPQAHPQHGSASNADVPQTWITKHVDTNAQQNDLYPRATSAAPQASPPQHQESRSIREEPRPHARPIQTYDDGSDDALFASLELDAFGADDSGIGLDIASEKPPQASVTDVSTKSGRSPRVRAPAADVKGQQVGIWTGFTLRFGLKNNAGLRHTETIYRHRSLYIASRLAQWGTWQRWTQQTSPARSACRRSSSSASAWRVHDCQRHPETYYRCRRTSS
jgi:hypothetical protein